MEQEQLTTTGKRAAKVCALIVFLGVLAVVVTAAVPQTVGADNSYVVLSDSMSPSIDAGSMVYVTSVSANDIQSGDVLTYIDSDKDRTRRVTHRVVDIVETDGKVYFRTKGDANEAPDPELIPAEAAIGVVQFHLPLVGYGMNFAQSSVGIVVLIVVPALLLLGAEVRALYVPSHEE